MSNYFLDTEFIEGTQSKTFLGFKYGETKPTIDIISLGLVSEDNREYYAISKDFNFKEAWYRYDLKNGKKVYWLRDNVLMPIHYELTNNDHDLTYEEWKLIITKRENGKYGDRHYNTLKALIKAHGKTNKEIAEEVIEFCEDFGTIYNKNKDDKYNYLELTDDIQNLIDNEGYVITKEPSKPVFYAYYADYDWVVFCWLFGLMKNLPNNFPYYCRDLKQMADEIYESTGLSTRFESPKGEHNARIDSIWNKDFYDFLIKL